MQKLAVSIGKKRFMGISVSVFKKESQTEPKENEHRKPKNTKSKDGVLFRFGEGYILLRRTLIKGTPSRLSVKRQIVAG